MPVRILYLGERAYGNLEGSFSRAFTRLGCEVRFVDVSGRFGLSGTSLVSRAAGRLTRAAARALLPPLLRRIAGAGYDLLFLHKTPLLSPELVDDLRRRAGARLFCFCPDDPLDPDPSRGHPNVRRLIPFCDVYFTFARFIIDKLGPAGARQIEYLPFAHDPELHHPLSGGPRCDVAFVGNYSAERARGVAPLLGHDLALWGGRWQLATASDRRFARAIRGGAQVGAAFARIYGAAAVGLNLIQVYPDGHNMRSFEAPACGGLVLSTRTRELSSLFEEDREIACFGSPEELEEKVDRYLADPQARTKVAAAGRARVAGETYLERARRVLDVLTQC
jgi:spore maturation protein CgeB